MIDNKDKDSKLEFSFVTVVSNFFRKKIKRVIRVKKKKRKEFVVVKFPSNDNENDLEQNNVDEIIDNKKLYEKKKKSTIYISTKKKKNDKEKVLPSVTEVDIKAPVIEDKKIINNDIDNAKVEKKDDNTNNENIENIDSFEEIEEKKNVLLERKIASSFEEYLNKKKYLVDSYLALSDEYKNEFENALLYDEACDVSAKIESLLDKINKLKEELNELEKSIKFDSTFNVDDDYFLHLLDEYKKEFNQDYGAKNLESAIEKNKYNPIIIKLYEIEQTVDKLSNEVNGKKSKYSDRDNYFEKLKEKFYQNDDVFDKIKFMIKESDQLLNDLEYKVANSKKIVNYTEKVFKKVNNNLTVLLLGYLSIKKNPLVPKTVKALVATNLFLESVRVLFTSDVEYRSRQKVVVENYENEIIDGLKSVDDIFELIDNTMVNVVDMRKEFESKFKEYDLPEYKDILGKLDDLSKHITERRNYLKYAKEEFSLELEKNKVMVKNLDYRPYDEEMNENEDLK